MDGLKKAKDFAKNAILLQINVSLLILGFVLGFVISRERIKTTNTEKQRLMSDNIFKVDL